MKKYNTLLAQLGLTEQERLIYLTLLEHPYLTMSDIALRAKMHRPQAYKIVAALESEGLVEKSYLDGKRYYYHAASPEKLRQKLKTINTLAETLLPELEMMYSRTSEAPILSVKEWIEGIRDVHRDLVETLPVWGIYYRYSSSKKTYHGESLYTPEWYRDMQSKKSLERIVITSDHMAPSRTGDPNRHIVNIPRGFDAFDDNITKLIYANKVAVIDYDAQIGWVIESERFARYEEKIFRLLVKLLSEKNSHD